MVTRILRDECSESRLRSFLDDRLVGPESRQLTDHLDHCEPCRATLERLAAGSRICADLRALAPEFGLSTSGKQVPAVSDERHGLEFLAPPTEPGSLGHLGPYDVTEVLGRGAFGIVLKAFDPSLSRFVAIKVLAAPLAANAPARTRFAREARAAAAVVHDNVVAIHAVDSFNGLPYLVMPCIAGRSLQERVDRDGPLTVKEVLRVAMQAALGLAAAHDQGLVHRDIKPSNILLENGVERVKLSDFGLARAVDDASQTQSGVIAGTPQYMSPEQARGESVDHRSDLFSLGGVIYFMCAGHPPFRADSTPAVLRRVCDDRHRPIRDVNLDVPDWLAQIIDRLLEKDAGRRFATANEIADVLKHHLAQLQRTGTSSALRPIASPPKSRRAIAAVALILAALGAGAIGIGRGLNTVGPEDGGHRPAHLTLALADESRKDTIKGSGVAASKVWDVADFNAIQIGSTFHAEITRGEKFRVTTTSDDNMVEHIQVVKNKKTLTVGLENGLGFQIKEPLKIEIVLPALEELTVNGASKTKLDGFRSSDDFKLTVNGASAVVGSIEVGDAMISVNGASHLTLKGSAKGVHLSANGASHLKLTEFPFEQSQIGLNGASHGEVTLRSGGHLKANATGSSILTGTVDADQLSLKLEGASVAKLEGKAKSAALSASGSSRLELAKLVIEGAVVKTSGASRASVDVRNNLMYELSSSSRLEYAGKPASLLGKTDKSATLRAHP